MKLQHSDKIAALKRINELDATVFLTPDQEQDYRNRIEIVEEYDKQYRAQWKAERKQFFTAQLKRKQITQEEYKQKIESIDSDADAILGKPPVYAWSH